MIISICIEHNEMMYCIVGMFGGGKFGEFCE